MKVKEFMKKWHYENIITLCYGISIFFFALLQSEIQNEQEIAGIIFKALIILASLSAIIVKLIHIKKLKQQINKTNILIILGFGILMLFNILHNGIDSNMLFIVLFIWLFDDVKIEKIFKGYSIGTFLAVAIVITLWKFDILVNYAKDGRNYLGFIYATFAPNLFFHACLALVAWRKEQMTIFEWIAIILFNVWIYEQTTTKAIFYIINLLCIGYYLLKIKGISKFITNNKYIKRIVVGLPFIFATATIVFQLLYNGFYNKPFFENINRMLNGRPELTSMALENYPITLLGQDIEWRSGTTEGVTKDNYFYVDSSYLQVLLNSGILMLVVLCTMMTYIYKYAVKEKNIYLILALTVFLIHCITDPQLLSFRYNPFLLAILIAITKLKDLDKEGVIKKNA